MNKLFFVAVLVALILKAMQMVYNWWFKARSRRFIASVPGLREKLDESRKKSQDESLGWAAWETFTYQNSPELDSVIGHYARYTAWLALPEKERALWIAAALVTCDTWAWHRESFKRDGTVQTGHRRPK
jgi:hypothetical protein